MQIAKTDSEILGCFDVMNELRPEIKKKSFLETIRMMQLEGFVLSFLKEAKTVVSVAGFRVYYSLAACGKSLYIYDLVTSEASRSKGFGGKLINDIHDYALKENCILVHLDSHVRRHAAHRFYLRNNYDIVAHHFWCQLK